MWLLKTCATVFFFKEKGFTGQGHAETNRFCCRALTQFTHWNSGLQAMKKLLSV
jgi:hypothetical protein